MFLVSVSVKSPNVGSDNDRFIAQSMVCLIEGGDESAKELSGWIVVLHESKEGVVTRLCARMST